MASGFVKLSKPPIVEAVVDIDCDLPPAVEIRQLEAAGRACFEADYPTVEARHRFEHEFRHQVGGASSTTTRQDIEGYLFRSRDGKQLVQVRADGFSFNRLAPYMGLDHCLPEIERRWTQFAAFAKPVMVRVVRLQYINRLMLPLSQGGVELDDYLKVGPRLPDPERLRFAGFLNQYVAVEVETRHEVRVILTAEPAAEETLPVVLTIIAGSGVALEADDWPGIHAKIQMLRELKNRVFHNTLTEQCLKLYQ